MLSFIKENQVSKEWRLMKITIDFENGMVLSVKPENLSIGDTKDANGTPHVSIAFKTDAQTVPFLFFKNVQLATKEELEARTSRHTTDVVARPADNTLPA